MKINKKNIRYGILLYVWGFVVSIILVLWYINNPDLNTGSEIVNNLEPNFFKMILSLFLIPWYLFFFTLPITIPVMYGYLYKNKKDSDTLKFKYSSLINISTSVYFLFFIVVVAIFLIKKDNAMSFFILARYIGNIVLSFLLLVYAGIFSFSKNPQNIFYIYKYMLIVIIVGILINFSKVISSLILYLF